MRKFQEYFLELTDMNFKLRKIKNTVKRSIGDSIKNHRTLSVNQVLRFADGAHARDASKIYSELTIVYDILKPHIKANRKRTDAVDMGELVSTYRTIVMERRRLRKTIGRRLGNLNV